jgi:hypothetical protein
VIALQYSTSTAFASMIIRRLCHSEFSHVDIVIPGEGLLGVSGPDNEIGDPGGVMIRSFHPWVYLHPPKTVVLETDKEAEIIAIGRGQIGKPFDNTALWDFFSDKPGDRDWTDEKSWFCSEYIVWCFVKAGFFPYPLVSAKNRITPGDSLMLFNPFMVPETLASFKGVS